MITCNENNDTPFVMVWGINANEHTTFGTLNITLGTLLTPDHLCPDLLRYENIGAADGWRGRVVRAFFWLMRGWPVA